MENHSLGRLLAVLLSPQKTFQAIAARPTWLAPLIVYSLFGLAAAWVVGPKVDWTDTLRAQLERSGAQVAAEKQEAQLEVMEKVSSTMLYVGYVLSPWLTIPLLALLFLGVGRVLGSQLPFKTSLAIQTYSWTPWALVTLLTIPVALSRDEIAAEQLQNGVLASNLSVFATAETPKALASLFSSLDFFSFWTMFLLVVGYTAALKIGRNPVAFWVVGLWLGWVVIRVALAAIFG